MKYRISCNTCAEKLSMPYLSPMRYIMPHLETITGTYTGNVPLAHFLKTYFRQYPILGSRDRKILSAMAYGFYRCAKALSNKEKLFSLLSQWLEEKKWLDTSVTQWVRTQDVPFDINGLCPGSNVLSTGISKEEWLLSMLEQPSLFIRIRKEKEKLLALLGEKKIPYTSISPSCLSLPNGANIDTFLLPHTYVVQDASSQQTGAFFNPLPGEHWYDCCSGAGGKSLLLKDLQPDVHLTVTDKRDSIIHNLQQRFRLYNLGQPRTHIADVADAAQLNNTLGDQLFDHIICDAPCSGSGTWARTPEQLYFFDAATLPVFAALQKKIAANVSRYLKPGGRLLYITCSVFKNENEDVVAEISKQTGLQPTHMQVINGTAIKADSMFVAVMKRV